MQQQASSAAVHGSVGHGAVPGGKAAPWLAAASVADAAHACATAQGRWPARWGAEVVLWLAFGMIPFTPGSRGRCRERYAAARSWAGSMLQT
ncbi:MAG: hypothetical protein ACPIOQ_48060 [Promethearchaeia archaeon]